MGSRGGKQSVTSNNLCLLDMNVENAKEDLHVHLDELNQAGFQATTEIARGDPMTEKAILQPLSSHIEYPVEEMKQLAITLRKEMQCRRTVRDFSIRPVSTRLLKNVCSSREPH